MHILGGLCLSNEVELDDLHCSLPICDPFRDFPSLFHSGFLFHFPIFSSVDTFNSNYTINWQWRTAPCTLQLSPKIITLADFCWNFELQSVNSLRDFFVLIYLLFFPSFLFPSFFPSFLFFQNRCNFISVLLPCASCYFMVYLKKIKRIWPLKK